MKDTEKIRLGEVAVDDTLVGIDGYVIDVERGAVSLGSDSTGRFPYLTGEDFVTVTMNGADGEEFYLIAPDSIHVEVSR